MRRQRIKSPISVVSIRRVIDAIGKAGMSVATAEVRPDGAIVVGTTAANDDVVDIFAQWANPVIEGVHFVRKRLADDSSRWHVYAWRGGPQVMSAEGLKKPKPTEQAIAAISAELKNRDAARTRNPTTLMSLIRAWRSEDPNRPSSPEWERSAATTKKTWDPR